MISTIIQWWKLLMFTRLSKELLTLDITLSNLPKYTSWCEQVSDFIDTDTLMGERFDVEFENVQKLSKAIKRYQNNIVAERADELQTNKQVDILLDDWLVDDESYRITLTEFLKTNTDRLNAIISRLEESHKSEVAYQVSNGYPIFVTLRAIVEVCHRRL